MNLCRTCKYWGVFAGAVGYGTCLNVETSCNVNLGQQHVFMTTQDFGCPFHAPQDGTDVSIYSTEEQVRRAREFYRDRPQLNTAT